MVANTLACRSILYTTPGLAPWSSNGGNSINKKIIQHLKKVGNSIPGAGNVVDEHIARMGKGKKVTTPTKSKTDEKPTAITKSTPTKSTPTKSAPAKSTPTKRKRATVVKVDEDDFDDY